MRKFSLVFTVFVLVFAFLASTAIAQQGMMGQMKHKKAMQKPIQKPVVQNVLVQPQYTVYTVKVDYSGPPTYLAPCSSPYCPVCGYSQHPRYVGPPCGPRPAQPRYSGCCGVSVPVPMCVNFVGEVIAFPFRLLGCFVP
jgi:hypothetical protein